MRIVVRRDRVRAAVATGLAASVLFLLINPQSASAEGLPPTFSQDLQDRTDLAGSFVTIDSRASDQDSTTLTYSASGLPPGITIENDTGFIAGTIDASAFESSPYNVKIVVTDPEANGDMDSFVWTISKGGNADPKASDRSINVDQDDDSGTSLWLLDPAFVSDPDGDPIFLSGLDLNPANGTLFEAGNGEVTYIPDPGYTGSDSFWYEISDGNGGTATASVLVKVEPKSATTTTSPTTTTSTTTTSTTTTTVPASTTTTTATTTTTVASTTTTFGPAVPSDPEPVEVEPDEFGSTTATLESTTTTTRVEQGREQEAGPPAPMTSTTPPPPEVTRDEATRLKEALVIVARTEEERTEVAGTRITRKALDPVEGLAVSFGSAVETLQTHLLSSIVLGVVLAVLLMLGVEEKETSGGEVAT